MRSRIPVDPAVQRIIETTRKAWQLDEQSVRAARQQRAANRRAEACRVLVESEALHLGDLFRVERRRTHPHPADQRELQAARCRTAFVPAPRKAVHVRVGGGVRHLADVPVCCAH